MGVPISIALDLYRSVYLDGDDDARALRERAALDGAPPELVARAARLRAERIATEVTVIYSHAGTQ